MKIRKILTMNQKIQHVVTLTTNLKTDLDPIEFRALKELGRSKRTEQILLVLGFRSSPVKFVRDPDLEKFLIGYSNFHGKISRTVFLIPRLDKRYVQGTSRVTTSHVERSRGVIECDTIRSVLREKWSTSQNRTEKIFGHRELLIILILLVQLLVLVMVLF